MLSRAQLKEKVREHLPRAEKLARELTLRVAAQVIWETVKHFFL
ncbi:hypothetical protein [Paractinoplanes globisporus]|uniref:Uncharacterized protein n=1 Tax=Paractinoplanes globisporus TaxID=113565 RepID=A0ABW6WHX0_9ACTN|nr:hypothetical protein [Actinoplanes globisporus]